LSNLSEKLLKSDKTQSPPTTPSGKPDLKSKRQTEHCMVCGEVLQYQDKSTEVSCSYCKRSDSGHIVCPNGHYICEQCHNQDAMRVIEDIIFTTKSIDPNEIAELAFSFSGLPMLGCQHAYIAGGAFMAALKNKGTAHVTNDDIKEVFKRTRKQAHGGYCGLSGVCGIVPALGACISVLTGAQCGKGSEQRTTMEAVTRVTRVITDLTGPSCCKAYVRASLKAAVEFLDEHFAISLPSRGESACQFSPKHPHGCREMKCPYFELKKN